ncbi:MAG: hypothetical protein ABH837_02885 [bacterium]
MVGSFTEKKGLSKGAKIGLWIGGIVLIIVLIIVGLWLWGTYDLDKKAQESGNLYPENNRSTYLSSCSDAGENYEDFCLCSLEYFEENYSYEQFKDFKDEPLLAGKSYSQTTLDATNSCSDKIPK